MKKETSTQIYIAGGSITYGVGAVRCGWGDMIKYAVHDLQYGSTPELVKDTYEVYNFAKPGFIIEDVANTIEVDIEHKKRQNTRSILLLSIGMNNVKAKDTPDNYLSTLESFELDMRSLFDLLRSIVDTIVFVGYTPVNEAYTTPKPNPLTGGFSFFFNKRIQQFDEVCKKICEDLNITYVDLFNDALADGWNHKLTEDGIHPNDDGHALIYEKVWQVVKELL